MLRTNTDITVVIPTLGGNCLEKTVELLNKSTITPTEILICIPESESHSFSKPEYENVRVVVTPFRGQVAQRAFGFKKANTDIVMQLDDDIHVEKHCIENLVSLLLNNGPKVAVAPALFCTINNKFPYINKSQSMISRIYYYILNGKLGYMPGTVTKAGTEIGVDPSELEEGSCEVEWLPGGCVMHFKNNLFYDNFYPFSGKAYCEDLFHSHYLKLNGIHLLASADAICFFQSFNQADFNVPSFVKNLYYDFRARKYYVSLTARNSGRMFMYYMMTATKYLFDKKDYQ